MMTTTMMAFLDLIVRFIYWVRHIFDFADFDIKYRSILYTIDDSEYDDGAAPLSDFWKEESKKWDDGQMECWSIVDNEMDVYLTKPINVTDIIFYTKYYYNNKSYIKMSPNRPGGEWPPSKRRMMRCTLPIKTARLIPKSESDDSPKDITDKMTRYAGPNNDFHDTTILTPKMFSYTEEYLEETYPIIEIENIIGQKVSIPSYEGSFTHQSLWSPSKISTHLD